MVPVSVYQDNLFTTFFQSFFSVYKNNIQDKNIFQNKEIFVFECIFHGTFGASSPEFGFKGLRHETEWSSYDFFRNTDIWKWTVLRQYKIQLVHVL